ncbi:uncharacterized protein LOC118449974 isoform X1 [Vespa mandarinia]|uniref:uncharacterized protein LOC118449974 isoform X1 n=1 Tax=Vespa mandarinia TaxID=7446 RepID=UPI00161555C1|nr:uncharacterized protein LOC118449974 isoform X1 [Vespa mandarinia]XP_035741144.1 uncharacterized protein LOC118449974 isoform X1 [Vespa mandarinia]XP_035741145.1 uncharacterized protein LOC118449974 isoform X1 [Vespa mandarinia]XP_047363552.1 uncharacterized protein LOC124954529 isoform X1 [Vespa velutina]
MAEDTEICGGFLDAKLSGTRCVTQKVRKRSLAPWKVWKRHWCTVKKLGPGLGIEIQLDYGISSGGISQNEKDNSIVIPYDAIVYRTQSKSKQFAFGIFLNKERKPLLYLSGNSETETQRWMSNIRQLLKPRKHRLMDGFYNISIVDNAHSRLAGLTGLYGDLVASQMGVFIKDIHSGEIIQNLKWKEMKQFHLTTAGRPEDVKRICVIHTTKEFNAGVGELHVFCLKASKLLQDLVTQGRGPKHKHIDKRPLSLSEGDLRISGHCEEGTTTFPALKSKIAFSLINAGLGLLLSSRSGNDVKSLNDMTNGHNLDKVMNEKQPIVTRVVDNVYQQKPTSIPDIVSSIKDLDTSSHRRISNVSVASGVYEEIIDNTNCSRIVSVTSNFYEDPEELIFSSHNLQLQPPPLPPRQRCGSASTRNGSISEDGLDSEGDTRSVTPNDITPLSEDKIIHSQQAIIDHSEYVPMSPRPKVITSYHLEVENSSQEEIYMVMQ